MRANKTVGILLLLLAAGPLQAEDIETTAKKLEGELMSPCCMTNTVSEHFSRASAEMKVEIRQMLSEGKTEQEIVDFYVAKHGNQILAVPPAEGFNLTAWLLPLAMLLLGAVAVLLIARRWRSREVAETRTVPQELDPKYVERVKRELQEMD